jgi:hypothetical protein
MDNANTALFDEIERSVREAADDDQPSGELIEVDFERKTPWKPTIV